MNGHNIVRDVIKRLPPYLFGIFLLIATLLSSVSVIVFDHSFYTGFYQQQNLAEKIGVSEDDLHDSIFLMTDYVEGKREDLNGTVRWKGNEQETFNAREKKHMVDVRKLWQRVRRVRDRMWILAVILGVLIMLFKGLSGLSALVQGLRNGVIVSVIVVGFFAFWYMTDFTSLWTWFHTVFFAGNSDWLLNPNTDFMIVICPENLFSTMIAQIALRWGEAYVGTLAILQILSWNYQKVKNLLPSRKIRKKKRKTGTEDTDQHQFSPSSS